MTGFETMTIYFYAQTNPYAEFSNFAPFGVAFEDEWWPTVEHYFQAQKFEDAGYQNRIQNCGKLKNASTLGRTRAFSLRDDWEQVKDAIMYAAVKKKFETHPLPRDMLLGDELFASLFCAC
ncbi:NADAR family protein [Pararhizobium sp. IMCC21322]|uniref:NADAR family protein n=1 Tax=Pararhizobium sp. IMCC21322 TaxID=3067903 RepID=UPI002741F924|nr:NADAR family protein [Pararhizobium sp. IMCC21322]